MKLRLAVFLFLLFLNIGNLFILSSNFNDANGTIQNLILFASVLLNSWNILVLINMYHDLYFDYRLMKFKKDFFRKIKQDLEKEVR